MWYQIVFFFLRISLLTSLLQFLSQLSASTFFLNFAAKNRVDLIDIWGEIQLHKYASSDSFFGQNYKTELGLELAMNILQHVN